MQSHMAGISSTFYIWLYSNCHDRSISALVSNWSVIWGILRRLEHCEEEKKMVSLRAKLSKYIWWHYCGRKLKKLKQDMLGPMDSIQVFARKDTEVGRWGHSPGTRVLSAWYGVMLGKDQENQNHCFSPPVYLQCSVHTHTYTHRGNYQFWKWEDCSVV